MEGEEGSGFGGIGHPIYIDLAIRDLESDRSSEQQRTHCLQLSRGLACHLQAPLHGPFRASFLEYPFSRLRSKTSGWYNGHIRMSNVHAMTFSFPRRHQAMITNGEDRYILAMA